MKAIKRVIDIIYLNEGYILLEYKKFDNPSLHVFKE